MSNGFDHRAFFYAKPGEFLEGTARFVKEGRERGAPTLVVLDAPKLEGLRAMLGSAADGVEFADMAEVGANPARIIPAWQDFVAANRDSETLYGIGEPISPARGTDEMVECHRHEALLNVAFADANGFRLLCPYDTSSLAPDVVAHACHTHPVLEELAAEAESEDYAGDAVSEAFAEALPAPPATAPPIEVGAPDLSDLRVLIAKRATAAGLAEPEQRNFVLAVNEAATNAVVYGDGSARVRLWETGEKLLCDVEGTGSIHDPLVGRRRPADSQPSGYGMWVANQLCDLVQVRNTPAGSLVRLHIRRPQG
jgi:anti-sigma regulatory factor (Ser/Thr protein kinase)